MGGAEQEPPGVNELAGYIVSTVKNEVVELLGSAGFDAQDLPSSALR